MADPGRHMTASMVVFDPAARTVLLVHHKAYQAWIVPGGHVEAGEDLAEAAVREVLEETGVKARIACQRPVLLPGMSWRPSPWLTCLVEAPAKPDRGPGKPAQAAHTHVDALFIGTGSSTGPTATAAVEVHGVRWAPLDDVSSMPVRAEVPLLVALAWRQFEDHARW